jgi:hypothetical protein
VKANVTGRMSEEHNEQMGVGGEEQVPPSAAAEVADAAAADPAPPIDDIDDDEWGGFGEAAQPQLETSPPEDAQPAEMQQPDAADEGDDDWGDFDEPQAAPTPLQSAPPPPPPQPEVKAPAEGEMIEMTEEAIRAAWSCLGAQVGACALMDMP